MKVLIGNAWPYANGLHIGHIAALLPGDVIARYHRGIGNEVYFVSGTDCYGTPVAISAKQAGQTPEAISDKYHEEFIEIFGKLGFSYDMYGKTSAEEHTGFVRAFHKTMYTNTDLIYEKTAPQAYCAHCAARLTDRLVVGQCPLCGVEARGDQCDACGAVLESEALVSPRCVSCGAAVVFRDDKHLYIAISKLAAELQAYLDAHPEWRSNAIAFTKRYIDEGLRDRAVTRALDWGVDVPRAGYEDKKIYIWAENVLGYLSMSKAVADANAFDGLWHGADALHYYVHGKDNIPFHTIILPALLLAHGGGWRLPDVIVSSEHLTLEGRKISSSQSWAIWGKDIAGRYDPDSLRYYLLSNGPERRDSDFSWKEYVKCHNGELLGGYGNFVNRSLVFVSKYFGGVVPQGRLDEGLQARINEAYADVGAKLHKGACKAALAAAFGLVREANKLFDDEAPWKTRETDPAACAQTLYTCVNLAANLASVLQPFLPFSSKKVLDWLGLGQDAAWGLRVVCSGYVLPEVSVLFARLDAAVAEEEGERLAKQGAE